MNAFHNQMMGDGGGAMMTTFGIVWLITAVLVLVALVLSIAALIKYLRKP